ncbi:hypothetical protein [Streptomyces orinoci]|uniref:Uncharacterized protein n=1 Tax=Streptomyces orinoci TaxID=67339 RepID=A0ABV3K643_STRON|nr:hypothetical protein [Streptomyces orinoci]
MAAERDAQDGPTSALVEPAAPLTAQEELNSADGQRFMAALDVINAMPDSVADQGEAAVRAYLAEHLPTYNGGAVAFGWWQTTKCVAAISAAVAGGAVPVAKVLKLKKFISKAGGVKEAAYLLIRIAKGEEKISELGATLGGLASAVLGVDSIKKQCR